MKILCLQASPRPRSNSSALAQRFLETAQELGAQTRVYRLNDLRYRGCQACMACKTKLEHCALKDDLTPVLAEIQACDLLVLASPVYYGELSGQLKTCLDRTYSFLKPDYLTNPQPVRLAPGKTLVMALAQGADPESFADIFARYRRFFDWYGFKECHLLRACGVREMGEVESRPELLGAAEALARQVCAQD